MRVLAAIVIPPHLSASGAVNAALALSSALTEHCHIDAALMSDRDGEERRDGLRVLRRRATAPRLLQWRRVPDKFRTLFYRSDIERLVGDYDLVHLHNPIPALEMRRIARACVARGIPYVVTTHGFVEVLHLQSAYQLGRLEALAGRLLISRPVRYVVEHAARICCLAPQDRDLLTSQGMVPADRTVVIPNGVKPSYYDSPTEAAAEGVRTKFRLPLPLHDDASGRAAPICFFLANHTKNKGLDVLLEAFLGSSRPFTLVVGGKKRDYDYESYERRAGDGQRIVFTDALSDEEIHALHHASDLFVFPSRADTLPLVVLEAMAAGRPVLSTRVGGIPFQVDDSCGRLVEPEDPTALRAAFEDLASDPARLRDMGGAARRRVRELFDWRQSALLTHDVYREVLGGYPNIPRSEEKSRAASRSAPENQLGASSARAESR